MTRLMSFSMTTEAYRLRLKPVTRRDRWWFLRPGDILMGVEKCQGIPKGEHVVKMHRLRVVSTRPEPLRLLLDDPEYGASEMVLECLCETAEEFCDRYIRHNGGDLDTLRNRIEFEHECPECQGDGLVWVPLSFVESHETCPTCHGKGWITGVSP